MTLLAVGKIAVSLLHRFYDLTQSFLHQLSNKAGIYFVQSAASLQGRIQPVSFREGDFSDIRQSGLITGSLL